VNKAFGINSQSTPSLGFKKSLLDSWEIRQALSRLSYLAVSAAETAAGVNNKLRMLEDKVVVNRFVIGHKKNGV
jgi:hypothetical protein